MFRIFSIDASVWEMAKAIHRIQMAAYAQEASLLGVSSFPPLEKAVEDVQRSQESFWGAAQEDRLVGVASIEPEEEFAGHCIASLVVEPSHQRRGVARGLMHALVQHYGQSEMTVQTGVKNVPALSLYGQFGFVAYRHWCVGTEGLEIVKLRRKKGK